jgi:hypothetical protein
MTLQDYFKLPNGYTIKNGLIYTSGSVFLKKIVNELPYSFDEVGEDFYCDDNALTTLVGSPRKVFDYFNCSSNKLINLVGGPISAKSYNCIDNPLKSFDSKPKIIEETFIFTVTENLPILSLLNYHTVLSNAPIKFDFINTILKKYCGQNHLKKQYLLAKKN